DNTTPDSALTIDTGIEIHANGGGIYPGNFEGLALINKGTISIEDSFGTLTIQNGGTFSNEGTMTVDNGSTLNIAGTWLNSGSIVNNGSILNIGGSCIDTGSITRTNNGEMNLTGVIDKNGGALALNASTGSWHFKGGTVKNATIT